MKELLQNLSKLQSIELTETQDKNTETAIAELRAKIPPQILAHYNRLMARGKKGIVPVRNQICTACHMRVPLGSIMTLRHGNDIQVCGSCGRYLFLVETPEVETVEKKPRRRIRKAAETLPEPVSAAH
jgi:predicted  nucleic acid-binding Zn-ribbon protein